MNEIIQSLEANATNGKEIFCYISENKLNAIKELSKREQQEKEDLQKQNAELKEEKAELKLELSGYRQAILNDKEMLGLKEENQELKEQLHKASLDIQELTEKDIWCPTNCDKLMKLKEKIEKAIEYINNNWDGGSYTDKTLQYKVAELNITELEKILKGEEDVKEDKPTI